MDNYAYAIIAFHNHPSATPQPSGWDKVIIGYATRHRGVSKDTIAGSYYYRGKDLFRLKRKGIALDSI